MATSPDPMKGRHATILYSAQSVQGTAVTPATSVGICSFEVTSDTGMQQIFTLGQAAALYNMPGILTVPWSIEILHLQTETLIARALRSSGIVPWSTFGFGHIDDAGTIYAWQVADCKINQLEFGLEAGGTMRASISGTGGLITALTTGMTMLHIAQMPLRSYEFALTKGGSAYEKGRSFSCTLNNNIDVQPTIPGSTPATFKRGWNHQTEGHQPISGSITKYTRSTVDLQAATLTDFAMVLTGTDIVGGMTPATSTFTYADAQFTGESLSASPESDILWTTPFVAKTLVVS